MTHLKSITSKLIAAIALLAVSSFASAGSDYDQPAVGGYDLVSYHQDSGPVRGTGFHPYQHDGVTFLFSTDENKELFAKAPEKYLPAYNGYCAFGVSLGKKFNSNPTVFEIVDGGLYLNLDGGIQKKWQGDIDGNIKKADNNWDDIADKPASEL